METVSDGFFLALAEISSALTGLFLVGIVLYIHAWIRWLYYGLVRCRPGLGR